MAGNILDASALLAVIFDEPGADQVLAALRQGSAMSAVNVAEVASRLFQDGWNSTEVALVFDRLGVTVLPFTAGTAITSGSFRRTTGKFGLGIGDRACIATAFEQKRPALTADKAWLQLELPDVAINCIR